MGGWKNRLRENGGGEKSGLGSVVKLASEPAYSRRAQHFPCESLPARTAVCGSRPHTPPRDCRFPSSVITAIFRASPPMAPDCSALRFGRCAPMFQGPTALRSTPLRREDAPATWHLPPLGYYCLPVWWTTGRWGYIFFYFPRSSGRSDV